MKNLLLLPLFLLSNLLLAQNPVNDECSNASILLPSSTRTYSNGDLAGATQSSPNGYVTYMDVFYKYVATSTINIISVVPSSGLSVNVGLYSSCSAQTPIDYSTSSSYNSFRTIISTNQIIGNTYYIKVGNANATTPYVTTFTIAVVTPPINTTCDGAINITPSTSCNSVTGDLTEAIYTSFPGCPTNEQLFYKFTAASSNTDITFNSDAAYDLNVSLYSSCSSGPLYCINNTNGGGKKIAAANLVVGNTYYVRVGASYTVGSNVSKMVDVCVQSMPVKTNDECANATSVTPSPTCTFINGDLAGATQSTQPVGCVSYQDVFYKFVPTTRSVTITLNSSSGLDIKAMLFPACPLVDASTASCVNNGGINTPEIILASNLTIGNTYYLSVGSVWAKPATTDFSMCIQSNPLPVNDECANAIDVIPSSTFNYINGDLAGANMSTTNGCLMDNDIFYKFTATTASASILFNSSSGLNLVAGVYASCSATTPLYCITNSFTAGGTRTIAASNLTIGNTYYIKVGSYKYAYPTTTTFSMCVAVQPVNDECAGAISVTPSTTCTTINGDLATATQSTANGCSMYKDVFYKFVAASASTDITFTSSSGLNLYAALYNSCSATTPLYCATSNYSTAWAQKITATGLVVGNTYYIRVGSAYSGPTTTAFSFCVQTISTPANDECTSAINLSPSTTCTYTTADLAGASQSAVNGCTMYQDVFYKFTATAANVKVAFNVSSGLNLVASLYADCAASTPLYCLTNTYTSGGIKSIGASSLVIGNTYYIKVGSAVATPPLTSTFGICIQNFTPVANDEITDAINIVPSTSCTYTNGDLEYATQSAANGCGTTKDVFYKFVAASTLANISASASSGLDLTLSLYAATTDVTPMYCANLSYTLGYTEKIIANVVAGNTYYIKVGSSTSTTSTTTAFGVCVQTLQYPANDACVDAIELIPGASCTPTNGDIAYAKWSGGPSSCTTDMDVYYKFTATSSTADITLTTSSGFDAVLGLFDNCTATSSLYCSNNAYAGGGEFISASNLIVGNTYYIKIVNGNAYSNPTTTTFTICVQSSPTPSNDDCVNAISIIPGTTCSYTTGNLAGSSKAAINGCNMNKDVFYKFVAASTNTDITITGSSGLNIIAGLYASCAATTSLYCVNNSFSNGGTEKISATNLTVGSTYFIKIGSGSAAPATTDFTICVQSLQVPVNEDCAGALTITPSASCNTITGDLAGSGPSALSGCTTYKDIFYKFTATSTVANITFTPSSDLSLNAALYDNCSATAPLFCKATGPSAAGTITATGLTIGNTYYVKAGALNTAPTTTTFTLCIQTISAPVNDECVNALTIIPKSTCTYTTGDLATASQSVSNGCVMYKDLFYKFVAQASNTDIAFSSSTGLSIAVSLQTDCNSTTPLYCINNSAQGASNIISATNLIIGNTYYIKVGSSTATPTSTAFSVCVRSGIPVNDDITNPTSITPATSCISTTGNLLNATSSATNGCTMYNDVFYKFVAAAPHYKISFTPSSGLDLTAALYLSTNNTVPLNCINSTGVGGLESMKALDLTIGSTYYIKVGSYTNAPLSSSFSFCIENIQASNDECAAAISVTPSATCNYIAGDLDVATKSFLNGFDEGKDVFYKFVANSNSILISTAPQGNSHIGIGVLSSCTKKVYTSSDTMRVDNLIIGNTYYIQLTASTYNASSAYSLCVQSINNPDNDECANAILVPASYITAYDIGKPIFADLSMATKSVESSCSQTIYKDRYYKFVAKSATLHMNFNNSFNLFSGLTLGCGSGAEVKVCGTNSYGGTAWGIFNMIVGETYYLKLGTLDSAPAESTFSFALSYLPDKPLPVNDECAGALTIVPNTTRSFTKGNLLGALRTTALNDNCPSGIKDVFYKFVATSPNAKIVLKPGQSVDYLLALNSSCPATQAGSLGCKYFSSGTDSIMATNLTVGNTYYIKIACDQEHVDSNKFELLVESLVPPANDECVNATLIPTATTCNYITADLAMATQSTSNGCTSYSDVFYKFVANSTSANISYTSSSLLSLAVGLYSSCNTALPPLYCSGYTIKGGSNTLSASNLLIGNTYYIKVGSSTSGTLLTSSFTICVQSIPPLNDEFASAVTITPGTVCSTTTGDLLNATQSAANGCAMYKDLFYKFVATVPTCSITVMPSTDLDVVAGLYASSNTSTPLYCVNTIGKAASEGISATNLTIGDTYYIRVGSLNSSSTSTTFTVCVQNMQPANDECANAVTLIPSTNIVFTPGDLANSNKSLTSTCIRSTDVYYKFTATSSNEKIIVESSAGLDAVVSVFTSCSASSDIICQNNAGIGATEEVMLSSLVPGSTYYIMVGDVNTSASRVNSTGSTSTFNISIQEITTTTAITTSQVLTNIAIYPNPSYGDVYISNIVDLTTIEILSIDGKVLLKKEISSDGLIHVESLPSGIYIIRFTYRDVPEVRRIEIIK